jgi:hypothetical protein
VPVLRLSCVHRWCCTCQEMLQYYKQTTTSETPSFRELAPHICCDQGKPAPATDADYAAVHASLDELPSFTNKLMDCKAANWFSANLAIKTHRAELHALKAIIRPTTSFQYGCVRVYVCVCVSVCMTRRF